MGADQDFTNRNVDGTGTSEVAPQAAADPTSAQVTNFPPRPEDTLNTSFRPTTAGDVEIIPHPIEIIATKQVIPNRDVITIRQSYDSAVDMILDKLHAYAEANGANVESSWVRSSLSGPISWLLTRKGIAEWMRRTFPVEARDLTRQEADGTTTKVCQVRISKGFFSGKAQVTVLRYPGGDLEGDAVEKALGLKTTPVEGIAPATAPTAAAPGFRSALEAEIAQHLSAKEEKRETRKRMGLGPKASESEVQEMQRLVSEIESDAKDLMSGRAGGFVISPLSTGTNAAFQRSYKIQTPGGLRQFQNTWDNQKELLLLTGSIAAGASLLWGLAARFLYYDLHAIAPVIGLAAVAAGAAGAAAIYANYPKFRHNRYLEGSLRSKEPGSLGAVVDSLHQAGLNCDIRVGAWDRKEMRVDLKVTYKPKTKE